ncbi:MAG: sigma-70 family RNA polymerase sigma factor [Chloroflexi bacterium]|nr:sigma-70 family RNA polymerase sigma factor [Chloroflexota bacterium]
MNENELIQGMKDGDEKSYDEFCDEYAERLKGFVMNQGVCKEDAEEIVNDAMNSVFTNIDQYNPQKSRSKIPFRNWVYEITKNKMRDFLRKEKRMKNEAAKDKYHCSQSYDELKGLANECEYDDDYEINFPQTAQERALQDALERLAKKDRTRVQDALEEFPERDRTRVLQDMLEKLSERDRSRALQDALEGLSERDQTILSQLGHGCTYDQTAVWNDIPRDQIRVYHSRAKDRLRNALRGVPEFAEYEQFINRAFDIFSLILETHANSREDLVRSEKLHIEIGGNEMQEAITRGIQKAISSFDRTFFPDYLQQLISTGEVSFPLTDDVIDAIEYFTEPEPLSRRFYQRFETIKKQAMYKRQHRD